MKLLDVEMNRIQRKKETKKNSKCDADIRFR